MYKNKNEGLTQKSNRKSGPWQAGVEAIGKRKNDFGLRPARLLAAVLIVLTQTIRLSAGPYADSNWVSLGTSPWFAYSDSQPTVNALAFMGTNLYAGGNFTNIGGVAANFFAKWDGSNWSAGGGGVFSTHPYAGGVSALATIGTNLYVGGFFTNAGGVAVNNIAKWDGSNWSALGSGINGQVNALAVSGTNLYVGGGFTSAGGVAVNGIAQWNGTNWSALGTGGAVDWRSGTGPFAGGLGNESVCGRPFHQCGWRGSQLHCAMERE